MKSLRIATRRFLPPGPRRAPRGEGAVAGACRFRSARGPSSVDCRATAFAASSFRKGDPLKVIDVTEFFSERGGGVRTHLEVKGRALRDRGHRHLVIAPGPKREPMPEGVLRVGGPSLPYDPSYHLLLRADRVLKAIRAEQPDVLEVHSPYLAAAAALLASRRHFAIRTFFWHADFIDTYLRPVLEQHLPSAIASGVLSPVWVLVRELASRCDG